MTCDPRSVQSGHWKTNISTRHGFFFLESIAISSGYQASPIVMLCWVFLFQVSRAPAQGVGKLLLVARPGVGLDVVCIIGVAYVSRHVSPQLGPAFKRKKTRDRAVSCFCTRPLDIYGSNDVGACYNSREADCGECLGKSCLILASLFEVVME